MPGIPDVQDVISRERTALAEGARGGTDEGTLAVNTTPSTPAKPAEARWQRTTSRDPEAFPAVTGREEDWRFTPLARLRGLLGPVETDGKVVVEVAAPEGVTVETVGPDDPRIGSVLAPEDVVSARAMAGFTSGTVITVPAGSVHPDPITVSLRGEGGTAYGHVLVEVGEDAEAVVVLDHTGSATYAGGVELHVGQAARLTVLSLQDWADDAVHVGAHAALLERDAVLRSGVATLGGDLVRLSPTVRFAGPGGDAELWGLYVADGGQHLEHRLFVDHDTPHCRSRVTYKGALQGEQAHTVWIGDVLIRAAATGTDTYELNRNLLLTDGARADSVPNLEIETGEIAGAGHASATGRFDEEQLFYLQARGIPADEALRLVVLGFFTEVVQAFGVPSLTERLVAAVEAELEVATLGSGESR